MPRRPDATPSPQVTGAEVAVDVAAALDAKVEAVGCYATQVPFQFRSAAAVGPTLRALADAEGRRCGLDRPAEVLRGAHLPEPPP